MAQFLIEEALTAGVIAQGNKREDEPSVESPVRSRHEELMAQVAGGV